MDMLCARVLKKLFPTVLGHCLSRVCNEHSNPENAKHNKSVCSKLIVMSHFMDILETFYKQLIMFVKLKTGQRAHSNYAGGIGVSVKDQFEA